MESVPKSTNKLGNTILGINIAALLAVAAFFRIWRLSNTPGLNGDEAFYGATCLSVLHGFPIYMRTPSGNPLNIFYFLPVLLVHVLLQPSVIALRLIAVLVGLATPVVNYLFCRKVFDSRIAICTSIVLAVLPENIVQSRIGWDCCESVLAVLCVMYCSLMRLREPARSGKWLAWSVVALVAAVSVHPTNIFALPFIIAATCLRWHEPVRAAIFPNRASLRTLIYWLAIVGLSLASVWYSRRWFAIGLAQWGVAKRFGINLYYAVLYYFRLFNGIASLRYIAGSLPWTPHQMPGGAAVDLSYLDVLTLAAFTPVFVWAVALLRRWRQTDPVSTTLVVGWSVGLVCLTLIGGPGILAPGNERYGLCLIAPGCLMLVQAWFQISLGAGPARVAVSAVGWSVAAWAVLGLFNVNYFQFIARTGGKTYNTLRTGPIEPKLAAWNYIRSEATPGSNFVISTSQWWNLEPLRYFSYNTPACLVVQPADLVMPSVRQSTANAMRDGRLWLLEFADDDGYGHNWSISIIRSLLAEHQPFDTTYIRDPTGRPVLVIIRPEAQNTAKLILEAVATSKSKRQT